MEEELATSSSTGGFDWTLAGAAIAAQVSVTARLVESTHVYSIYVPLLFLSFGILRTNNMPVPSPDHDSRRQQRRRHSTDTEDDRPVKYHSSGEPRAQDNPRSEGYRTRRSRSPRDESPRNRRKEYTEDDSPAPRHRSYQDHRRHSRRDRSVSRSPPPKTRRRDNEDDRRRSPDHRSHRRFSPPAPRHEPPTTVLPPSKRSHAPLPSQATAYKQEPSSDAVVKPPPEAEKQKPNYAPTGKLAAERNTVANTTIVLKYNEPPEARLPPASSKWRLYVFKGKEVLETLSLYERSCWLFGRERAVVDFPIEHPSCSKQHAVLQFRYTEKKNGWGERKGAVKPYLIDLESANGTKVNGEMIPERRYVELKSADVITFGESTREYVVLMPPKEENKL